VDTEIGLERLDYLVVVVYVVALLSLGFWVSFRKKHTTDLFLAGRSLRWPNIGFSMFGTNVSPTMMIGLCGIGYGVGMVAANFDWLAWLFLMLLAMVYAPRYLNMNVSTMPQFIERRFGRSCHAFVSWYTLLSTLILWLSGALYAGALLLGQIMGWPLWVSVVVLTVIATSFTVTGGLAAVAITDTFQMVLMITSSAALVVIALVKIGGIGPVAEQIPADYWLLFRPTDDPKYPWYAILMGYPATAVWFWCTDQTIVQRVLAAKDLRHAQYGSVLVGYLKAIAPFLFILPGILCLVLYPDLSHQDEAYMTMVTGLLPQGMRGLVVAVLIAALVSTVDSGLNSFGTVLTLDIYQKTIRPEATGKEIIWIGRIATFVAAAIAVLCAVSLGVLGKNLFDIITGIIGFLAPSMTAVFLVGIFSKRATSTAALITLVFGTAISLVFGYLCLSDTPKGFWPHYLVLSFYLSGGLTLFMYALSLMTRASGMETPVRSIKAIYAELGYSPRPVWIWWSILAVIMAAVYAFFQLAGS